MQNVVAYKIQDLTTAQFIKLPDAERDLLVSQHVLGLASYESCECGHVERSKRIAYCYTTNLLAAWDVVEKEKLLEGGFVLCKLRWSSEWSIGGSSMEDGYESFASASTVPLVICIAALKLRGYLKE